MKKVPDLIDHFTAKAKNLLTDRNHGNLLAAATLIAEMCQIDPNCLTEFRSVGEPVSGLALTNMTFVGGPSPCSSSEDVSHHRIQPRT